MIPVANTVPLSQALVRGYLPNVQSSLLGRLQPLIFGKVTKRLVNFEEVEAILGIPFRGSLQPFKPTQLLIKPEGQRNWGWEMLHATPDLILKNDDIGVISGVRYRVMETTLWTQYGYIEYQLVNAYVRG